MITDDGLRLATSEALVAEMGTSLDALGSDSVALALDNSGFSELMRQPNVGTLNMSMAINVDAPFTSDTDAVTFEIQLVSLPILASKLTSTSGSGKQLNSISTQHTNTGNFVTITDHGLPFGTPVRLVDVGTTTIATNGDIMYVIPRDADTFQLAGSLELARAGTALAIAADGTTLDLAFIPTVHASTGTMATYKEEQAGAAEAGPLSVQGERLIVPVRPLATKTPKTTSTYTGELAQTEGVGPQKGDANAALIGANAQRYFYLRYIAVGAGSAVTGGTFTVDLVLCGDTSLQFTASGYEVIG